MTLCPIRNFEALEHCIWESVESHISYSILECYGMEILSVDVPSSVWLSKELLIVHVLEPEASEMSSFKMELVGIFGKVWNTPKHNL